MLYEQTISKMLAMKLNGMAEALEDQRKTAAMGQMSFEDRLEAPLAKSACSINATRRPRRTASRATPAPKMPPPITST